MNAPIYRVWRHGLRVYTNIPSMVAQRAVRAGFAAQQAALEKLATGSAIVRARDNPAGLIASELLRSDITKQRAEIHSWTRIDGVLSTAEGAMAEISGLLIEAEALVVNYVNAGVSDTEKEALQLEYDSIVTTIDRIADTTRFNGKKLLDGTASFGFGEDSIALRDLSSRVLGLRGIDLNDGETAQAAVRAATESVAHHRAELGAFQKYRIEPRVRSLGVSIENLSAMESLIRDADVGRQVSELVRAQILTQSSMLALRAAMDQPRAVLGLLGG